MVFQTRGRRLLALSGPALVVSLPAWAQAGESRREHIARVVELLERWAQALAASENTGGSRAATLDHVAPASGDPKGTVPGCFCELKARMVPNPLSFRL